MIENIAWESVVFDTEGIIERPGSRVLDPVPVAAARLSDLPPAMVPQHGETSHGLLHRDNAAYKAAGRVKMWFHSWRM